MKVFIQLLIILLFGGSCFNENVVIQKKSIIQVSIHYVHVDVETPISIKCSNFEAYFKDFKILEIKNKGQIDQIVSMLNSLKLEGTDYKNETDTRIKLCIKFTNDSTETICIDRFHVLRSNKLLVVSDSLKRFLSSKLNQKW